MVIVAMKRPSKRQFLANPDVYTNVEYDIHLDEIRRMEVALNDLAKLTADRCAGRVHGDYEGHLRLTMNDIKFQYTRPAFRRLDEADKEVFRATVRAFGVYEIAKSTLHDVVRQVYRSDLSVSAPLDRVYVHRPDTVMGQLGTWSAVQIFLKKARQDAFLAFDAPQEFDPLGLVSDAGFSLTLYPTEATCVIEKTNGISISAVKIGLTGQYVCLDGHQDPYCLLNTDTDQVFNVTCMRDAPGKPLKALRVRA